MTVDVLRDLKERHNDQDMLNMITLELARRDEAPAAVGSLA